MDTLRSLEELWLGKNRVPELKVSYCCEDSCIANTIKNLSSLSNLKILSVPSNHLSTISGLEALLNLEELYISHNDVTEISGLDNNHKLRVLDISSNAITNLSNLQHLKELEELWASSNRLSSFMEVEKELKDKERLNTVYFEGNPLQTNTPVLYRNKIRLALPQIQQIDASMQDPLHCRLLSIG